MKRIAIILSAVVLAGCGTSSYQRGVAGNVLQYREFSALMHHQQNTLNSCFNAAGQSENPNDLALCAVLAASTNAQQTLAGQPAPIRIAKSPGEIAESIAKYGFDATVKIFGLDAMVSAYRLNSRAFTELAATNAEAQAGIAKLGIEAAAKDPLVVHPTVIHAPAP